MTTEREPPDDDDIVTAAGRTEEEAGYQQQEPVELEITDVLDLHSFPPREVKALVGNYLDLAADEGLTRVRIIHGKGIGAQRRLVRTLLERHPRVRAYGDAPAEAGGWGATWVELSRTAG